MYLPGYGSESTLMGGADVAVSRDSFATNNNPAGLSQLTCRALDLNFSVFHAEGATHSDGYGNYRVPSKTRDGGYGNFGYAQPIADSPFSAGVGLVVQGGVGWAYKNITTAFGTHDEATSLFSIVKLVPGISYRVNDELSLGMSVGFNYIAGAQTLFPDTSVAPSPALPTGFAGINFKDASGHGFTTKLGLQYRPIEDVMIGVTYGSKTDLPMKGGTLRVNYSNYAGINQVVRYDHADMDGFGLPEEIAVGIAFRPMRPLLVSAQYKLYKWSDVLKGSTLRAWNSRVSTAPPMLTFESAVGAGDQEVYSLGVAYEWRDDLTLMAGVNYGARAVPPQNLAPTFQVIQQMHYMVGVRKQVTPEWMTDIGLERLPQQMVTYNNPMSPFGPSVANHSGTVLHMQASRRWN